MRVTLKIERWVPVLLGLLGCMTEVDLEEAELDLEESEASLVSGLDVHPESREAEREVRINHPTGALCSGTLMRSNVVLTAKHCLTTTGVSGAPEAPPAGFSVTQLNNRTVGVARIARHPNFDAALLFLNGYLNLGGSTMGGSTELSAFTGDLAAAAGGAEFPCFGWGRTRCDDPSSSGELHKGYIPIASSSDTHIRYTPGVIGNIFAAGDAGGACYAPTRGGHDRLLGVTSQGSCASRVGIQVRATAIADWFEQEVDRTHYESSFSSSIGWTLVWQPVNAIPALDGTPIWNVTGGKLVEPTDSRGDAVTREGNLILQRAAIVMNGYVQVTASGTDTDGSMGIVFRVRDDSHYYAFIVNGADSKARIVRRNGAEFTVLGEAVVPHSVRWPGGHRLSVSFDGNRLWGWVDYWPVVDVRDADFTYLAGRVGLYDYGERGTAFDDFVVHANESD